MRDLPKLFDAAVGWFLTVLLLAMTILTFADVSLRVLTRHPIAAAFEITEFLLAMMLFAALYLGARRGQNIALDLIDGIVPPGVLSVIKRLSSLLLALMLAGSAVLIATRALRLGREHSVSVGLGMPYAPFVWFIALMLALMAVVNLFQAIRGGVSHA